MSKPAFDLVVADIGGTNTRFALVRRPGAAPERLKAYKAADFARFEDALEAYLAELGDSAPSALALGAAGPVIGGSIHMTNLSWLIEPDTIREHTGMRVAVLCNDLVAMAAGIAFAPDEALVRLPGGSGGAARRSLVIAVGTGLGAAWYERAGDAVTVHSTEAGHAGFSPATQTDLLVAERLLKEQPSVSFETIVSGAGIRKVYSLLKTPQSPELARSEDVLLGAENGTNQEAHEALDVVLRALVRATRNFALVLGGAGEIIFAGGLGRRLRPHIASAAFLGALRDHAGSPLDFSGLDVKVALDDTLPLQGAANLAYGLVRGGTH